MTKKYDTNTALFEKKAKDIILSNFKSYRRLCAREGFRDVNEDKKKIKSDLKESIYSELELYLESLGIEHKLLSSEEFLKNKDKYITDHKTNKKDLEKLDAVLAPYLTCLQRLDQEIDNTADSIIANVKNENKFNRALKVTGAILGSIAISVVAFTLTKAALVAGVLSGGAGLLGLAVLAPVVISSAGGVGAITSILSGKAIYNKLNDAFPNFDKKDLNKLSGSLSQLASELKKHSNNAVPTFNEQKTATIRNVTTKIVPSLDKSLDVSKLSEKLKQGSNETKKLTKKIEKPVEQKAEASKKDIIRPQYSFRGRETLMQRR